MARYFGPKDWSKRDERKHDERKPARGGITGCVEAPVWNHLNGGRFCRAGEVRLATVMDWLLRRCPEYIRMREAVSLMSWESIADLERELDDRPLRLVEARDGDQTAR